MLGRRNYEKEFFALFLFVLMCYNLIKIGGVFVSNYDSILKEKKTRVTKVEEVKPQRSNKVFVIDFFVTILILAGSYVYYYFNILTGENVFFGDINYLFDECKAILNPIFVDLDNDIKGNFSFDNNQYDYEFGYNGNKYKLLLSNKDSNVGYYYNGNNLYMKLGNFMNDSWIINNDSYSRMKLDDVIKKDNFIKKFYFISGVPLVEVNYSMNQDDVNKLLGFNLFKGDMEFIFTFRNHSITNQMLNGKLVISNKSKKTRTLLEYKNNRFILTKNNGKKIYFRLEKKNNDFTLKIYKEDVLYSVLTGIKKDDSYLYSYQIIDRFYNLAINFYAKDDIRYIDFTSNIEEGSDKIVKKASITFSNEVVDMDADISNSVSYKQITKDNKNKFKSGIKEFFLPIREFVFEYKDGIK